MIPNMPTTKKTMLDKIQESEFFFYLTGSRFFGYSGPRSDWDFFCEKRPGLLAWLSQNGFTYVPSSNYKDATEVYYFCDFDGTEYHIQIVENAALKLRAQDILNPFIRMVPKDLQKEAWKIALEKAKEI